MTAYAPSDVRTVSLGDGCGQPHTAPDNQRLAVDCEVCAPLLIAQKSLGWAADPLDVALTPDERHRIELDKDAAQRAQALAMQVVGAQLANLARTGVVSDPRLPVTPPDLDGLSDEELERMEAALTAARATRSSRTSTAKRGRSAKAA